MKKQWIDKYLEALRKTTPKELFDLSDRISKLYREGKIKDIDFYKNKQKNN